MTALEYAMSKGVPFSGDTPHSGLGISKASTDDVVYLTAYKGEYLDCVTFAPSGDDFDNSWALAVSALAANNMPIP